MQKAIRHQQPGFCLAACAIGIGLPALYFGPLFTDVEAFRPILSLMPLFTVLGYHYGSTRISTRIQK